MLRFNRYDNLRSTATRYHGQSSHQFAVNRYNQLWPVAMKIRRQRSRQFAENRYTIMLLAVVRSRNNLSTGAQWNPTGAQWNSNGAQWNPNGCQWSPNGAEWNPNGVQWHPNGPQWATFASHTCPIGPVQAPLMGIAALRDYKHLTCGRPRPHVKWILAPRRLLFF